MAANNLSNQTTPWTATYQRSCAMGADQSFLYEMIIIAVVAKPSPPLSWLNNCQALWVPAHYKGESRWFRDTGFRWACDGLDVHARQIQQEPGNTDRDKTKRCMGQLTLKTSSPAHVQLKHNASGSHNGSIISSTQYKTELKHVSLKTPGFWFSVMWMQTS